MPVPHAVSSSALFNDPDHGRLSKAEDKASLRKIANTTGERELKVIFYKSEEIPLKKKRDGIPQSLIKVSGQKTHSLNIG